MKIYTRGGDKGETGLIGGSRIRKDDPRLKAYGSVDELSAHLGFVRSLDNSGYFGKALVGIQKELFVIGSLLACPDPGQSSLPSLNSDSVKVLENLINEMDRELPPLSAFILPGGAPHAAALHLARTVCRRCEREVVALARSVEVEELVIIYLNRLSDLLFVSARMANHLSGERDELWNE
ncbi:MAG: cob(I)yrinic acid a,c-diamide adenosyltransferase [bacterium]|nr:cob(I)yrinic acid a,c-diamide adenosyltransferase [bacterium]